MIQIFLCNCNSSLDLIDVVQNLPCDLWMCISIIVILILVLLITLAIVLCLCHKRTYKEMLIEMCMWKSKTHTDLDDMLRVISKHR